MDKTRFFLKLINNRKEIEGTLTNYYEMQKAVILWMYGWP